MPRARSLAPAARWVALWTLLWTGLGLFFASEAAIRQFPGRERSLSWGDALTVNIPFYLIWGVVALAVLGLCRLWPIAGARLARNLGLHVAASLAVASLDLALAEGLFHAIRAWRGAPVDFSEALSFSFRHNFHVNVVTYWAVVGVYHLVAYYRGLREKELIASRLEEQLARAELSALRMQLQPHFLFNALHSISELVYSDPAAADRMLVRLSDLLRQSLETTGQHEVPLEQELEYVERYLEIERMRFEERLRTRFQIEAGTEQALLPSLLLQPLVENAIKYAVSPQEAGAEITIAAQLVGPNLRITVSDTGPGLQSGGSSNRLTGVTFDGGEQVSTGVGLANIRDRLAQAYGEDHRFETMEPPEGGFAVLIEIPFERREAAPASLPTDKRPALAG